MRSSPFRCQQMCPLAMPWYPSWWEDPGDAAGPFPQGLLTCVVSLGEMQLALLEHLSVSQLLVFSLIGGLGLYTEVGWLLFQKAMAPVGLSLQQAGLGSVSCPGQGPKGSQGTCL